MCFADEPEERVPSRLVTRLQRGDPRGPSAVDTGEVDPRLDRLSGDDEDLWAGGHAPGFNGVINGTGRNRGFRGRRASRGHEKTPPFAGLS